MICKFAIEYLGSLGSYPSVIGVHIHPIIKQHVGFMRTCHNITLSSDREATLSITLVIICSQTKCLHFWYLATHIYCSHLVGYTFNLVKIYNMNFIMEICFLCFDGLRKLFAGLEIEPSVNNMKNIAHLKSKVTLYVLCILNIEWQVILAHNYIVQR